MDSIKEKIICALSVLIDESSSLYDVEGAISQVTSWFIVNSIVSDGVEACSFDYIFFIRDFAKSRFKEFTRTNEMD